LSAFGGFVFRSFELVRLRRICFGFRVYGVSHPLRENFGFALLLIYSQSQEVQKKCSKTVNLLQFLLKTRSFLQKNAKKCKFLLIFTPILTPKTNKSYKITLFTTTTHPNFQNFPQKPPIS
jgi:hypothetical protein